MSEVLVAPERFTRWVANFEGRHGEAVLSVAGRALHGAAADGSTFVARLPVAQYDGGAVTEPVTEAVTEAITEAFAAAAAPPPDWGVLLVRRGGYAVARMAGTRVVESKVGKRHVQGRTKAGGWSQQRFARRRANQAREAFEAAGEHAARILDGLAGPLVYGGAEEAAPEGALRLPGHVPDPRRDVLAKAIADAQSIRVEVTNADLGH